MRIKILFLLLSQITFSQVSESTTLLQKANKAYLENDFKLAKELYSNLTKIDSKNKDAWYNLAASELNLEENENACEHFYNVYKLGDNKVVEEIKKFCPNFKNGTIMSLDDVDEKPKFILEEKEHPLFENKLLNPIYLKAITKALRKSKLLESKLKGKTILQFSITRYGIFEGIILKYATSRENEEIVKNEIMSIFRSIKYISAKNNGNSVDIWERWQIPLGF